MHLNQKYALTGELGKGHSVKFGRIFSGVSKLTGEPVVLKFVSKNGNLAAIERLRNESQFNFKSEGLPNIIDYLETDNECILVRNFQTGQILSEYWKKLSKNERVPFLIELIQLLNSLFDELKRHHVVHCDIKPSNILIRKDLGKLHVAIIDFGLGIKICEPHDRKLIFPLGFAAPELLLNYLELVDQRTDQFALGVTIWFLFTEQLPLSHPNPSIYTNLQLTHPLPDHSKLPKGFYNILNKMTNKHSFRTSPNLMSREEINSCLRKGIDNRYSSLSEVIADLEKIPEKKKNWFGF